LLESTDKTVQGQSRRVAIERIALRSGENSCERDHDDEKRLLALG
jgi:hypothetical protein